MGLLLGGDVAGAPASGQPCLEASFPFFLSRARLPQQRGHLRERTPGRPPHPLLSGTGITQAFPCPF